MMKPFVPKTDYDVRAEHEAAMRDWGKKVYEAAMQNQIGGLAAQAAQGLGSTSSIGVILPPTRHQPIQPFDLSQLSKQERQKLYGELQKELDKDMIASIREIRAQANEKTKGGLE